MAGIPKSALVVTHDVPRVGDEPVVRDLSIIDVKTSEHAINHHPESMSVNADGSLTLTGSELLSAVAFPPAIGGATSTVPQGGVLAYLPMNPRLIDGCRVAELLKTYNMFCIESIAFEYVQGTNLTQSGQLLMSYINDPDDLITLESGFTALRDAYSRVGSQLFSVRENARATMSKPLLKWYYTGSQADTQFDVPGFLLLSNMVDVSNATDVSIPLGTLAMHYRIRVRSPSVEAVSPPTYAAPSASLVMTGQVPTINVPVFVTVNNSTLPSYLTATGVVYWGSIVAADDVASGNMTWRTWRTGTSETNVTLKPGNLLFWRTNGQGTIYFFPTFAAAADAAMVQGSTGGNVDGSTWVYSAGGTNTARGFKLWNVMGSSLLDF